MITVTSVFLCWYLSLYFSESRWPNLIIESRVPLIRCSLDEVNWVAKSPLLYSVPNGGNLYLADGLAEEPETKFWLLDINRNACIQTTLEPSKNEIQHIHSSEEHFSPIVYPPLFSRAHVIQSTQFRGGVWARWLFRGLRLKRPVYFISFMGGGTHWGLANSYIGTFYLEVYRGKEKLFVVGNSVYGATWGPVVASDYLEYDASKQILLFTDKYYEPGIVYWTHLKE